MKLCLCFVNLEKACDRLPKKINAFALRNKGGADEKLVEAVILKTKARLGYWKRLHIKWSCTCSVR